MTPHDESTSNCYKRIMPAEYELIEPCSAQILQSAKLKIIVWQWL